MPQISIGQVENLEDLVRGLEMVYEQSQADCSVLLARAGEKTAEAETEVLNSQALLKEAEENLRQAQQEQEEAERRVQEAEAALNEAENALKDCEAVGGYDDDGNYIPPDCSSEECEVSAAQEERAAAQTAAIQAAEKVEAAAEKQRVMRDRLELAAETLAKAQNIQEALAEQCKARLQELTALAETGATRLSHAQAALEAYLASNAEAKAFYDWLHWKKAANDAITPKDLHDRFNLSSGHIRAFLRYQYDRDPAFREKIAGYRRELAAAQGPAERKLVQDKIRKNFAGAVSEKIAEYALKPLGTVSVHVSKETPDGKRTITDIVVSDLNNPVILGKGKGMSAPKDGKLAVEVKSGHAPYLQAQLGHMAFQAQGHSDADASFTLCTRDIKDLSPEAEEALRSEMKKAGSPLIGMLPKKDELDKECWEAVKDGGETEKSAEESQ